MTKNQGWPRGWTCAIHTFAIALMGMIPLRANFIGGLPSVSRGHTLLFQFHMRPNRGEYAQFIALMMLPFVVSRRQRQSVRRLIITTSFQESPLGSPQLSRFKSSTNFSVQMFKIILIPGTCDELSATGSYCMQQATHGWLLCSSRRSIVNSARTGNLKSWRKMVEYLSAILSAICWFS